MCVLLDFVTPPLRNGSPPHTRSTVPITGPTRPMPVKEQAPPESSSEYLDAVAGVFVMVMSGCGDGRNPKVDPIDNRRVSMRQETKSESAMVDREARLVVELNAD